MTESGLECQFWFNLHWLDAMLKMQHTKNTLELLPGSLCMVHQGMCQRFKRLDAVHGFTSTQRDKRKESIRLDLYR
jgi:hypothetical protein